MSLIRKIKKWWRDKFYQMELTPYGECLKAYLERLENGSEDHIQAYDDAIDSVQQALLENYGIETSYMETVNLMSSYFSEYFS